MPTQLNLQPTAVEIRATRVIVSPIEATLETFPEAMRNAIDGAYAYVQATGLQQTAPTAAMYDNFGDDRITGGIVIPVAGAPLLPAQRGVGLVDLPARKAIRFTHRGPYETLSGTYAAIGRYLVSIGRLADEQAMRKLPFTEEYVSNPATTPPEQSITYIYIDA